MKILIIDDDEVLASVFATALKKGGFEVVTAPDGKSGFEKIKTEKPNLVLLDQVLPDTAGNDLLKQIKQDPETKATPVSMLSNFGQSELVQVAIDNGAIDYILKYQIEPEDLISKVTEQLKDVTTQTPTQTS